MPNRINFPAADHPALKLFSARIDEITSTRKVRPVVTPSGRRARGLFASIKAPVRARFESLLEQDVLRVLEVSSLIQAFRTHPFVLKLPGIKAMHYTPDVVVEGRDFAALIETKATYFLQREVTRWRLAEQRRRLKQRGIDLLIVVESDVQVEPLQDTLKQLLKVRPLVGRYRSDIDPTVWDPLGRSSPHPGQLERWRSAQAECDALLARVMKRDPGELLESETL